MKRLVLALFFVLLVIQVSQAQDYKTGIGVRGGAASGISFKQFLSPNDALEFVGGFYSRGLMLTVLYQRHAEAFDVPGLQWYYGGGGFMGFFDDPDTNFDDDYTVLGAAGVVGLEYKIDEIPISVGIDLVPAIGLFPDVESYLNPGLTVRYVF